MSATFTASGNFGTLTCDAETGAVIKYEPDIDATETEGYYDVKAVDVAQYLEENKGKRIVIDGAYDVLDFRPIL